MLRIKLGSGLVLQNILVILLIIIIIFVPDFVARVVFGLPFLLLFPGYTLILTLFPKRDQIKDIERVALSLGLSIAVVPLIGLILNYTPFGITLESTLYSVAGFIFLMSFITWLRLRRLDESERFNIELKIEWSTSVGRWDKVLKAILVVSVLAAIGVLSYVLATPKVGEKFTEFYVLGSGGEASGYPTEISLGEETSVILGIVNHEQETVEYRVDIVIDSIKYNEVGPLFLANDEKWQDTVNFSLNKLGDNQKVEFLLYKSDQDEVYRSTHLWIDVR